MDCKNLVYYIYFGIPNSKIFNKDYGWVLARKKIIRLGLAGHFVVTSRIEYESDVRLGSGVSLGQRLGLWSTKGSVDGSQGWLDESLSGLDDTLGYWAGA